MKLMTSMIATIILMSANVTTTLAQTVYNIQPSSYTCTNPTLSLDEVPIPKSIIVSRFQLTMNEMPPFNGAIDLPIVQTSNGSYVAEQTINFDPGLFDGPMNVTYKTEFGDEPAPTLTLVVTGICDTQNLIYTRAGA